MVEKLRVWLKNPDNSAAELAVKLGYQSSTTIYNWVLRNNIPTYMRANLKKLLK